MHVCQNNLNIFLKSKALLRVNISLLKEFLNFSYRHLPP
eukprot:UN11170